jgi:hypothetical protein
MAGNDRSGIKRYVVVSPLKVQVAKDFAAGFVDDVNSDIVKTADGLAIAGGRAGVDGAEVIDLVPKQVCAGFPTGRISDSVLRSDSGDGAWLGNLR